MVIWLLPVAVMGHVDWSVLNPRNPRRPSRSCQKKGCGLQGSRSDPGLALGLCQGPEATSPQATDTINEWYGKEEAECGKKIGKEVSVSVWGLGRGGLPDTQTCKQSPGNKGTGSGGQALESQGQCSSRGSRSTSHSWVAG